MIDNGLADIADRLRKLDFTHFRLIDTEAQDVEVMRRATIDLANDHQLTVRPTYQEDNRLGLWMKWVDNLGKTVLDTRLHLPCGEPVLAGTELNLHPSGSGEEGSEAVILVVKGKARK
jgi:hypothetical protein